MPLNVKAPIMAPPTSAAGFLLAIGLTSERRSLMDVKTFADWTLHSRLLRVPAIRGYAKPADMRSRYRQVRKALRRERAA